MNLHQIVSPVIGVVNPNQIIGVQVSVGQTANPDGTVSPAYATPGTITASIGGTFTASAAGNVLTVLAVLSGSLQAGDAVSGSDGTNALVTGAAVIEQLTGAAGGTGTYLLNGTATAGGSLNPCTVTSASTVLNVTGTQGGVLQAGQTVGGTSGTPLPGTLITGQLTGFAGGPGLYAISPQQTMAGTVTTTSMTLLAQIQAMTGGDLRHMDMLNLQGSHRAIYVSFPLSGAARVSLKGGDVVTFPDGTVWLVNQNQEPFFLTAGWQKVIVTLQDGA